MKALGFLALAVACLAMLPWINRAYRAQRNRTERALWWPLLGGAIGGIVLGVVVTAYELVVWIT